MNLVSRLDGYLNHEITHNTPIQVSQTPRMFQDKKDSTLLDMALRGLLKERMYGNLQNFQTENIVNKNHLKTKSNSFVQKRKHLSSLDQVGVKKNENFSRKIDHRSFVLRKRDESGEIDRKTKTSPKKNLSQFSSCIDIHLEKKQYKNLVDKKVQFLDGISQQNKYQEVNNGMGFISEIQHLQGQDLVRPSKINGKGITLPQIPDRRKTKNSRIQNGKISKALFTQNQAKITVKEEFWSFICSKKNQRLKRIKQSPIQIIQSPQNQLDESNNISTGKRSVAIVGSVYGDGVDIKRDVLKYNQNLTFRKETFQNFIGNEKLTIPSFVTNILSFFEVFNKFADRTSKSQFDSIFISLYNQSNRAWCFAIFQFLDSNRNGKIDSSDLFKVYNTVDSSKGVIERFLDSQKIIGQRQNLYVVNQLSKKAQITKRQKTVSSYNGSCSNRTTARVSIGKPIKIYRFDTNEQNIQQNQISIMKNNLQNIISFQKQIQILNEKMILEKNLPFKSQKISQNPQSASANKNKTEKCYLEQGLLDKKDVKVSQLGSILSEISPQNGAKTKKVLDIDHKKLNIKLTSSYLQTFIATNHNEETRTNREFLQNLKDKVKKMSKSKADLLPIQMENVPLGIQYTQFYEERHFLPFKKLIFAFMQILIQNK